ncbi:DUF87 domain-containing protein [Candidatus Pacearchaeota archaeon]|nr:DUF87 domain-containing protein [Candidatus Pacearchaeota archaeon]
MPYDIIIGRDSSDKKRFEKRGLIYLGKGFVKMGQYTSLSNPIYMDIARSHVVLVSGKRGCLTEGTSIFTDKGYLPIKDFNKENKILSFNKDEKKFEWENAELLEYPISENLIEIELEDGRKLQLTKEHPLLITSGEKLLSLLWMEAEKLNKGDKLISVNNNFTDLFPVRIKNIKIIEGIKKVYDLSVDKNHSFIANGIISHNSGKSYSLGVIAEELATLPQEERENIAGLILDTMGVFWTMKFENEKEKDLLEEWKLKPKKTPVKIFIPLGYFEDYEKRGIPVDEKFSISPKELESEDWITTFNLSITEPVAVLIEKVINTLKEENLNFSIKDIIKKIDSEHSSTIDARNSASSLFEAADSWKVFSEQETEISKLIKAGETSVLDLSMYSSTGAFNVRALVISLISKKLFKERMLSRKTEEVQAVQHGIDYLSFKQKREMPLVWIFIDEVHEFLPNDGKTPATDALIQLLREGRQPGISLVMATQQPGSLAKDAITQADIILSHRVTALPDIQALNEIMQSYVYSSINKYMDELPSLKGSAIILDDNSERIYPMRVRPKFTWHGGEAPTAVKVEKRL